jgi:hypothetical protein
MASSINRSSLVILFVLQAGKIQKIEWLSFFLCAGIAAVATSYQKERGWASEEAPRRFLL